jgi:hypothetical protein
LPARGDSLAKAINTKEDKTPRLKKEIEQILENEGA